jgi:hypothetical protein
MLTMDQKQLFAQCMKFEEKLYTEAIYLFSEYYSKPYNEAEHNLFDFTPEDITTIQTSHYYASYQGCCDSLLFLQDLHKKGLSRSEKLKEIRILFSEQVTMLGNIDNLPSIATVGEKAIRTALASIFSKLSDEIHQSSARFDGDSGNFILPRAHGNITIADTFAFAIIVKEAGLIPVYPNTLQEQSLVQKLFGETSK